MSTSGGGVFKEAERGVRDTFRKWNNDPWGQFVKTGTDLLSGTMIRYDSNTGKWEEGSAVHRFDEITGEISGRNKARVAGYETERRIQEAEELTTRQREEDILQRYRSDLSASRGAQAIRDSATARERSTATALNQTLGSDEERDYLGL